jgi:glyoxylate reductase
MTATPGRKPKLIVSRKLPAKVESRIAESYDAVLNADDTLIAPGDLAAAASGTDALLVTPTEKCTAAFFEALPDTVRIVATFSVGYDHVDIAAATARGVTVTNTPDVLTDATADIAMLLILGAARGASWGDRMVRTDAWGVWTPTAPLGSDVTGRRLGILGMGRIGRAVAKRARGFDMAIHYHNRTRLDPADEQGAVFHATAEDLLPHCDFLSINCASTPETRGLIDDRRIALMPEGAIVVNSARGDIVDDDALIRALQSGRLAAAGLDVFKGEPDIDPRYRELDNAFLLPHLGSATLGTRDAMGMRAVDNLDAFFAGRRPGDQVTPG